MTASPDVAPSDPVVAEAEPASIDSDPTLVELGRRSSFWHITAETTHPTGLMAYWTTNSLRAALGLEPLSPAAFTALGGVQWNDGRFHCAVDGIAHHFDPWAVHVVWPKSGKLPERSLTGLLPKLAGTPDQVHPGATGEYVSEVHEHRE